jgi:c-di-GMP-binding flagellar brake protein YcgR
MHDERRRVEARVPTGGGTAMLTPWHTPGAAPFAARLLNVSLGGLGLEVESESAQGLQIGGELVCRLDLRWLNLGQLRLSCRLVHRRDQGQGLSYLGLAIREPSGGESRRWLDCVERLHDAHRFNGVDRSKQIDPTQSDGAQA